MDIHTPIINEGKRKGQYDAGIYVRLSREDENGLQSESIQNQRDFLTRIVHAQGWNLVKVYCDDGFTGTNFDRPGFKRMIGDIESGIIDLVITKDLSRLGRDYIDTGYYLERYFPEHGVRYIAVNDGIDTFSRSSGNDISPFKSVMNDLYARDISNKVRTVMDTKRERGDFIGAFAPFGYIKDVEDKNRLIIDEKAAPVVRRIFRMYLEGSGYSRIAHTLNREGVLSPMAYKELFTSYKCPSTKHKLWTHASVKNILVNPTYAGNITQNKHYKINYKVKKIRNISRENWITVKDTHDPIIEESTFRLVQQMIENKGRTVPQGSKKSHLLSGLLWCGDCGERMTYAKTPSGRGYVICSKYKHYKECTRHACLESDLERYVLKDLRRVSESVLQPDKLLEMAHRERGGQRGREGSKDVSAIGSRLQAIHRMMKMLYEDRLKGILGEEEFANLSREYSAERELLSQRLRELEAEKKKAEESMSGNSHLQRRVEELLLFRRPVHAVLCKLIKKIEVFEDHRVLIHYGFRNPFKDDPNESQGGVVMEYMEQTSRSP